MNFKTIFYEGIRFVKIYFDGCFRIVKLTNTSLSGSRFIFENVIFSG
jgi:hypothetical protein